MMCKGKTKGVTFNFVAAVFLACYLANTAECSRRWKPLRKDVHKEADLTEPVGVYEGEILFGKSLTGPELELVNGTNQPSSNASVEDDADYQADFPAFPFDQARMDAWNQMTKSLQCGADQMHFKVVGSGHQHFAVDQVNGPSLPFPVVPPSCGYNMRRLPSVLHLSIPYRGCHILKRGGYYMLPLTWRGIPVVLSCQMPNWVPWHHTPPIPPVLPPWHPLAGQTQTNQPTAAQQGPVAWPMQPGSPWNVEPAALPAGPPTMPQTPFPYPFPWYHNHPHYHYNPYYNYFYYHTHPHYHYPYWLHGQMPTANTN